MTGFIQYLFVIRQSCQELVWRTSAHNGVRGREAFAVLLHLLSAEQLRPQKCFCLFWPCRSNAFAQKRPKLKQSFMPMPAIQ